MKESQIIQMAADLTPSQFWMDSPRLFMVFVITVICILFSIVTALYVQKHADTVTKNEKIFSKVLLVITPILMIYSTASYITLAHYTEDISNWREDVAYPYIEQQIEEQKIELLGVSLSDRYEFRIEKEEDAREKTSLKVIYKNEAGEVEQKRQKFVFHMDLKEGETPYIVFRELKKDLHFSVPQGWYFGEVHVPENYDLR